MGVRKSYAYHKPSATSVETIAEFRRLYSQLHDHIEILAPASRERSIALTELETSLMWAVKSVVVNDPDSEVEQ